MKIFVNKLVKSRKAMDPGQIFLYLTTIVVVGVILIFGYKAISSIGKRTEQVTYIKLKADLENSIKQYSTDYGSVGKKEFEVPTKYIKVCFADNSLINNPTAGGLVAQSDYPIIYDSLISGVKKNLFLVPDGSDSLYVGKMDAEPDFFCIDVSQGKIRVRLEGLGDGTKVTAFSGTTQSP